jgi:hypothetical protein
VRRRVIAKVHLDHDPVELGDARHALIVACGPDVHAAARPLSRPAHVQPPPLAER